jgi:hypothetical protein
VGYEREKKGRRQQPALVSDRQFSLVVAAESSLTSAEKGVVIAWENRGVLRLFPKSVNLPK